MKTINPMHPSSVNPNTRNMKKTIPRHIIIKMLKSNWQKKDIMYKGPKIRMKADFLSETKPVRKQESIIFKELKQKTTVKIGIYLASETVQL